MKLQFDRSQPYQLEAIQAVLDLFDGQPLAKGSFEVSWTQPAGLAFTNTGIANRLTIATDQILANLRKVQERHKLKVSEDLEPCAYETDDGRAGAIPLNFTVEMETGTGKTYVYLRTIYELHRVYGFKKFVIVVPSVAIREGVMKNLAITREHLQTLYDHPPLDAFVYDSAKLAALRGFATANAIQILVINIDSFAKDANVINQMQEIGIKPMEYIQTTSPIVIMDEPQNMETPLRKAAIHNLNPLCTLRYSATHRYYYNLVYSLNPVQAYDLGLVKQIEVDGITADSDFNTAYIELKGIKPGKTTLKAKVRLYVNTQTGVRQKDCTIGLGDDLFEISGRREMYKKNFILYSINAVEKTIQFGNGVMLYEGESQGGLSDQVMKFQMERAVKFHFEKEKRLRAQGIKVLSLFFIDRVAHYRDYDADGKLIKGKFALWFEEIFGQYAAMPQYHDLFTHPAHEVHDGYFSQDKGRFKDTSGTTKADNDTYALIMKDKERLLDPEVPLRFIFSHSALKEGWDNPNVFQICTLKESASDFSKRQEIGRGMRLAVDASGQRVRDHAVNVLTVIASESFKDFSETLQKEIQEETSVEFTGRIRNAREKDQIRLTKELTPENCPQFFDIWNRIKHQTRYRVEYQTSGLIEKAVAAIKNMPKTTRPLLTAQTFRVQLGAEGITGELDNIQRKDIQEIHYGLPDIYGYIQSRVDIARGTLLTVLTQSGRAEELSINPQVFLDNVVAALKTTLYGLIVDGIKYEQIDGKAYEMHLFRNEEIETYLSNLFAVKKMEKTLFNYIQVDSGAEREFAKECEADDNIKFFFKLPRGFKIPTPLSHYIPDWAEIFDNDQRMYFVAETKSTLDKELLRGIEEMKMQCGEKHFAVFAPLGVEYRRVTKVKDLY